MDNLISLSPLYSTTRLCFKLLDERYLGDDGRVKEEFKFKISFQELKIKNSKLIGKIDDKFETVLFLSEGEGRKGEGDSTDCTVDIIKKYEDRIDYLKKNYRKFHNIEVF